MKKFLLLMIALLTIGGGNLWATKKYATYGTPAGNGSWNAETHSYTWIAPTNNLMTIFEFPNGELADYTSIHLTTADYTDTYRICFMEGSTAVATIVFYSAGEKNLNFADRDETKNLDLSQISKISFGGNAGSGSITLSKAYLEKPTTLSFDETGKATIDLTDITVEGASLSYDDQTGTVTSTGTDGNIKINFDQAYDLSSLTHWTANKDGDDIVQFWKLVGATNDGSDLNMYSGEYDRAFPGALASPDFTAVTGIMMHVNATGTLKFTELFLTASMVKASDPHYTPLTKSLFNDDDCAYNLGSAQGTIYGFGTPTEGKYADATGYQKLILKGKADDEIRLFYNQTEGTDNSGQKVVRKTFDSEGIIEYDLTSGDFSGLEHVYINAVKSGSYDTSSIVYSMDLYKETVSDESDYVISGAGILAPSVTSALADASATLYDATGLTGTGITLTPANPNAIFIANSGVLANPSNVMVGTTIANLVVTDGYPMAVPTGASATAASYTRTMANTYGTVCLPFAVTSDANYKYYTLGELTADELTLVEAVTLPAGTPGVVEKLNDGAMTGSGALADVQAASGTLQLIGTFDPKTILASEYAGNIYAISNNQFVQATNSINLPAFRAFFTTTSSESAIRFGFEDEGVTGVNALTGESGVNIIGVYSLDGTAQPSLQKGVNIVKFSDGGVKKIMVK